MTPEEEIQESINLRTIILNLVETYIKDNDVTPSSYRVAIAALHLSLSETYASNSIRNNVPKDRSLMGFDIILGVAANYVATIHDESRNDLV